MMRPSNEEIYDALITLQNLCYESKECEDCPLSDEDTNLCCLERACPPKYWEINGANKWKAFG